MITDKKNNKLIKAAITFITASLFGPAGNILGGISEALLGKIFGGSVQVISNVLTNYTYDYLKEGFQDIKDDRNRDIEKAIITSLARSITKIKSHPDMLDYEEEVRRGIANQIKYSQDDLLKLEYFFTYWDKYSDMNQLSIELLDRLFLNMKFNLNHIDWVEITNLEDNLCSIIFADFTNLGNINNLKLIIAQNITSYFRHEFLKAMNVDGQHGRARLAIEYELSLVTQKIIRHVEQKKEEILSEEMKLLFQEAKEAVNQKIDQLFPYMNEILLLSKSTAEHLADIKQNVISIDEKLQRLENVIHEKKAEDKADNQTEVRAEDQTEDQTEDRTEDKIVDKIVDKKADKRKDKAEDMTDIGSVPNAPLKEEKCQQSRVNSREFNEIDENKVLPVELIHNSKKRLKGEVFAIELLNNKINIHKNRTTGRFTVIIDRSDVKHAVISSAAKTEICRCYVEEKRDRLIQLDRDIHDFLLGNIDQELFVIDLPDLGIPLRWASGGVLSVITLISGDGKSEQWSPFFFRDINPWGWNIALGASERQFDSNQYCIKPIEYELNYPPSFIYREFMEEMLILEKPPRLDVTNRFKRFYFDENRAVEQQREANFFAREHIKLRQDESLRIGFDEYDEGGFGSDKIKVLDMFDTKIDLVIYDRDGKEHLTTNVLITFNLLELGIEVIKVLEYEMDDRNYILDGEILLRNDGTSMLIRQPCALISHKALKRNFAKGCFIPHYTSEIQPSFSGSSIKNNEIKVFDWDISQRYSRMNSDSSHISEHEKLRYKTSYERFGDIFKDKNYLTDRVPTSFVPATAKALSLYFARKGR